jgi:hypothetical protein
MRLKIAQLRHVVKGDLPVEFARQDITSYSGLELLRRYFCLLGLHRRVREACRGAGLRSDYGCGRMALVVIALLLVGARRLEQLKYINKDPLVLRLCELKRMPTERTVVNWLKQFTQKSLQGLIRVNSELLYEQIEGLGLSRLTIDVDGSVVQTGQRVSWAFRGFNPHHRKNLSYYPLLGHLAQTGQILRLKNRPGNVHDSKGADGFLRELIGELRGRFGRRRVLEFRMDSAFFKEPILKRLEREGCDYTIKVPFWWWLGLKSLVASRRRWTRIDERLSCFQTKLNIETWGLSLRAVIYRKKVHHRSPKNFQLDLFSPDDGHYEYSAIATNKTLNVKSLWEFAAGRGAQEKTLAELRGEFALDVVPTNHYGANCAWQQLSILAHNLVRGFQLDTVAEPKPRSHKRTYSYFIQNARTLRFLLIAKAGRIVHSTKGLALRLASNPDTQKLYDQYTTALAA